MTTLLCSCNTWTWTPVPRISNRDLINFTIQHTDHSRVTNVSVKYRLPVYVSCFSTLLQANQLTDHICVCINSSSRKWQKIVIRYNRDPISFKCILISCSHLGWKLPTYPFASDFPPIFHCLVCFKGLSKSQAVCNIPWHTAFLQ
jgi:hypothetical protein